VVGIADAGLKARARIDASGVDERCYLEDLHAIVEAGRSPAAELLERFHGPWKGDIDRVFEEFSY
jgi:glutamate--cysteine ligase